MSKRDLAVILLALVTLAPFMADRRHDEKAVQEGRAKLAEQCGECRAQRLEAVENGADEIPQCETWCGEEE